MKENSIVAACIMDRGAYEQVLNHLGESELSAIGQHWFKIIGEYYARDPSATRISIPLLKELGNRRIEQRNRAAVESYLDAIPLGTVSAANVIVDILEHKREVLGMQLAAMLTNPESDTARVATLVERYQELLAAVERGTASSLRYLDFDELDNVYDPELIVPLYPKRIREQCLGGGAMPGHHILIYGRPEAGKSLFAINMAAGMLHHGKKVLYCGNEESIKTLGIRLACNLARANIRDFQQHGPDIRVRAAERGMDKATILELAPGTFAEVETAILDVQPDAVFIDQLPGIDVGEQNPVRSMDKAARGFRTILQKHGVVGISVSQAGDRTERHGQLPPTWLNMSDVYGSRTGLPAQCDMMIGLGYDSDMYMMDHRACSLPKNKIGGTHDGFKVRLDIQQSRVMSLGTSGHVRDTADRS